MENVRSITFKKNRGEFEKMISTLSSLGYANRWAILNAKDFGVPQSRSRCFMISVYGREAIDLPEGSPLGCRLLDYLDAEVDESLYLSSDRVAVFERHRHRQEANGRDFGWRPKNPKSAEDRVARAVILNPDRYISTWIIETDSTESGAEIILSGKLNRPNYHDYNNRVYSPQGVAPTIPAHSGGDTIPKVDVGEYRIRYLSDRESWRLMGFSEDRIDRAFAVEPSKTARYKAAGNSIVVPVLEAIFERILTKYDPHQTTIEHFIEVTE